MTADKSDSATTEELDDWTEAADPPEELDDEVVADNDEVVVDDPLAAETESDAESDAEGEEDQEALDELEAEELEMLTEDEASETLVADEAAEMRAIRRAEIAMDREEASGAGEDEFVCSNCFLVLKVSQRAGPRKSICKDCAA